MTWVERIEMARRAGGFTTEDVGLSERWVTCACGQQDPRIPRSADGTPLDSALEELGFQFTQYVALNKPSYALRTLLAIESRAAEVVAGIEKGEAVQ